MLMAEIPSRPFLMREWRLFRRMSQEELAECMGTDKTVISAIETGRRRWNADHVYKAARCLRCRPYQLFTTDPNLNTPIEDLLQRVPEGDRERVRRIIETFTNGDKNHT